MYKIVHIGTGLDFVGDYVYFSKINIYMATIASSNPQLFTTELDADIYLENTILGSRGELYNDDTDRVITPICREEFQIVQC